MIVPVEEVDWIEAAADYVKPHRGSERRLLRATMQALEARLDPADFLRVHRSHIVRLDRVVSLEPFLQSEDVLVLRNRIQVPVGRRYRDAVRARLGMGAGPQ